MLDLWLMVVMCLYTVEIPLSYYPSPVRFSVGWYTVRVFGFLSSSLVLIVLLYEIETLYGKLLGAVLGSSPRARCTADDRRRGRCLDRSRGPAAFDRNDYQRRPPGFASSIARRPTSIEPSRPSSRSRPMVIAPAR